MFSIEMPHLCDTWFWGVLQEPFVFCHEVALKELTLKDLKKHILFNARMLLIWHAGTT